MVISFHLLLPLSLSLTPALLCMQMFFLLFPPPLTPSPSRWRGDRLGSAYPTSLLSSDKAGGNQPPGPSCAPGTGRVPDTCDFCHLPSDLRPDTFLLPPGLPASSSAAFLEVLSQPPALLLQPPPHLIPSQGFVYQLPSADHAQTAGPSCLLPGT